VFGLLSLALGIVACSSEPKPEPAPARWRHRRRSTVAIGQLPTIDLDALLAETKTLSQTHSRGRARHEGRGTLGHLPGGSIQEGRFEAGQQGRHLLPAVPLVGITPTPAPLCSKKAARRRR
jgi:hypothetical protein